jgi:spore coat protein H
MPEKYYTKLKQAKGRKLTFSGVSANLHGSTHEVTSLKLRGKTTLNYERKSFSVSLDQNIQLWPESDSFTTKNFYLISLAMDKNYFHNRLAFELLHKLDLFHLLNRYTEVTINDVSQGVYLLCQRPQDWAKKRENAPYVARRGIESQIAKEKNPKNISKEDLKRYRKQYSSIYRSIGKYKGGELYLKLNELLNMEAYMKWMAFNHFIKNGDYTDEVYFYINASTGQFEIIPWDYDDIFMPQPHEGQESRMAKINPACLVFSAEDPLDVAIANDPYLYEKYLGYYKEILDTLNGQMLKDVIEGIYEDLYPIFNQEQVLLALEKDGYKTNLDMLEKDLQNKYKNMVYTRLSSLSIIRKQQNSR